MKSRQIGGGVHEHLDGAVGVLHFQLAVEELERAVLIQGQLDRVAVEPRFAGERSGTIKRRSRTAC